jgi:hypothetical protein
MMIMKEIVLPPEIDLQENGPGHGIGPGVDRYRPVRSRIRDSQEKRDQPEAPARETRGRPRLVG